MRDVTRQRLALLVVVLAALLMPIGLAGSALAATPANGTAGNGTATATPTPTAANNTTNATTTPTPSGPLSMADTARLTPVPFNKDYLRVQTVTADEKYKTTGPYVVFATNHDVKAARISQSQARARVLDGSRTIKVEFAPDAAPPDNRSLYTLQLFFEDGSTKKVDIMAQKTDLAVVSATVKKAGDFIEEMKEDAQAHGYEPTLQGLERYHEWEKEQADLFNDLFGTELEKMFGAFVAIASSALMLIAIGVGIILLARRLLKTHGHKLKSYQNSKNLADTKRRELEIQYREDASAASESRLEDVPLIGSDHVFWSDALGVETEAQLARLFAFGRPVTDAHGNIKRRSPEDVHDSKVAYYEDENGDPYEDDQGNIVYKPLMAHEGIKDLEQADDPHETWLEPMLRPDMLGSYEAALAQAKNVLKRMSTRYGQPQYREARGLVRDELHRASTGSPSNFTESRTNSNSFNYGTSSAGGDD